MIMLYSGTPGSGKSFHAVKDIVNKLKRKKKNMVIANFPLKVQGKFEYWDNADMTIPALTNYAFDNHVIGVEGQTLVVIDEAQCLFNSRDWNSAGSSRMDWIKFFSQHRKLGFNFILIAQFDRMLDRQIRCLIEYDYKHLKVNNGFFCFLPVTTFLSVQKWYGQNMKLGHEVIFYSKKLAGLYDSYALFDTLGGRGGAGGAGGDLLPEVSSEAEEKIKNAPISN